MIPSADGDVAVIQNVLHIALHGGIIFMKLFHKGQFFEWDDTKNQINYKKHGIPFEDTLDVFSDPMSVVIFDEKHSVEEERYLLVGLSHSVVIVAFTVRYETIRIISARAASKQEINEYYGIRR